MPEETPREKTWGYYLAYAFIAMVIFAMCNKRDNNIRSHAVQDERELFSEELEEQLERREEELKQQLEYRQWEVEQRMEEFEEASKRESVKDYLNR